MCSVILQISIIVSIVVCFVLAWLSAGLFAIGFFVAGIDILGTMRGRPFAKSMYPELKDD